MDCNICLGQNADVTLECFPTHTFHKGCIDEWKKQRLECPICKIPIKIKDLGKSLYFVKQQTPEIIMAAVKRHGYDLEYVPVNQRTPEICLAAVQTDGCALAYVPMDKPTKKIESFS